MKEIIPAILFIVMLTCPGTWNVHCQSPAPGWDIFASDSVLELRLLMDLDSLLADLGEEPSYHEARLVYNDPRDQNRTELNVNVRARGSFRKNPENCDFPPLKFKFDKAERQGSIFENSRELKLVTHCQNDLVEFEQYVLQEYLIYKAYNILTDFSIRVRLARITYIDDSTGIDSMTRFAFLLEDAEAMAERNQGVLLDIETISEDQLDQDQFALMSLFNYMILNTDYAIPMVHNIELVSVDHFSPPLPVPYDFDWSGMINIPYDSPYAALKTRYAGRKYKGPCIKRKDMELTLSALLDKREQLHQLFSDFPYLEEDLRSRSLQELNLFFIIINSRELVRQEFIKNCDD